jgi:hypothetical protein
VLHLPLSYLSKSWFWQSPPAVSDIEKALAQLPEEASVATQVNISAHLSHRDKIYILWPTTKNFSGNSPCDSLSCRWFRTGQVDYILVDTSDSWDARHFLESKEEFIDGIQNLEKTEVINKVYHSGNASLYKVVGKL